MTSKFASDLEELRKQSFVLFLSCLNEVIKIESKVTKFYFCQIVDDVMAVCGKT